MNNELTNLLPEERQRSLSRDYALKVGVVAIMLVTALVLVSALLLLPTYVFLARSSSAKEGHLASLDSTLSSADGTAFSARLSALYSDIEILTKLGTSPSASSIVRTVLAVPHPGVSLSGFSYTPAVGKNPAIIVISGTASLRDSLRTYQMALQSAEFSDGVVLPVSAYAKDRDIVFTVTVTLKP